METYLDYQVEDVADASNAHMKPTRAVWYVSLEERHLMKELILGSKDGKGKDSATLSSASIHGHNRDNAWFG